MAWVAKVNRHVAVLTEINGKLRRRPAVITSLGAGGAVTCRVGHHGETYADVSRQVDPFDAWTATVYVSY